MRRSMATAAASVMAALSVAAGQPSPQELLDKYEAIRGKFTSYIIEDEEGITIQSRKPGYKGPLDYRRWVELRFDGERYRERTHQWGKVFADRPPKEKGKGPYKGRLWDGTQFYQHSRSQTPNVDDPEKGTVHIQTKKTWGARLVARDHEGCASRVGLREKFYGDSEPIGKRLRRARRIRVRPQRETVRGSECYVIEAVSQHGKYTVWIDPDHSHQIARARVGRMGDRGTFMGKKQHKAISIVAELDHERFEKIDGVWIPMEGVYGYTRRFGMKGEHFTTIREEIKRKKVIFNPDHEAMKSFVPDFPNGTKVFYPAEMPDIEFWWKDGKVEPHVDEQTLNETVDQIMQFAKADRPKTAGAGMAGVSPPAHTPPRAPAAKDPPPPPAPTKDPARSALLWSLLGVSALLLGVGVVGILRYHRRVAPTQG